jgi:hypothetical protein
VVNVELMGYIAATVVLPDWLFKPPGTVRNGVMQLKHAKAELCFSFRGGWSCSSTFRIVSPP